MSRKLKDEKQTAYQEIIKWLEGHEGRMPKGAFLEEGKALKRKDMTEEQIEEVSLYHRWYQCEEKKILDEYAGRPIEEVPEEHREKIASLRRLIVEKKTVYDEIVEWLENHEGKMPKGAFSVKGRLLKREELTEEQNEEIKLYKRWSKCKEKEILDKYEGRAIEEMPEEYREKISKLRRLIVKKKTVYDKIIEWLEEHEGKIPRATIYKEGKNLTHEEMTGEEVKETNLSKRWYQCEEKKVLDKYEGRTIEEVPEEYREKIANLRRLIVQGKTVSYELIKWLEEHDGKMPRSTISENGKNLNHEDMTEEQLEEVRLYKRWSRCKEKEILDKYEGRAIEEVPEEYRERISKLRILIAQGKAACEELIKWLEEHDGKMPRAAIYNEGRKLTRAEMTEKELEETRLYGKWNKCQEKKVLDEYMGREIEEVPEEYRERIARLRELGQLGTKKDDKIKNRMRKAVARQVENNKEVRQELEQELEIKLSEDNGIEPYNE